MFKLRYFYLSLMVYYVLMLVITVAIELVFVKYATVSVETTMEEAAERALEQTQYLDDFLAFRDTDAYKLYLPTNTAGQYKHTNVIEAMWGISPSSEEDLQQVYDALYKNQEFANLMRITEDIRIPLRYYDTMLSLDAGVPSMSWYSIPRALVLGSDFIKELGVDNLFDIDSLEGKTEDTLKLDELIKNYGLNSTVRKTEEKMYFNTPLNNGLTYVNRELLSSLFVNNMDTKMRAKYFGNDNISGGAGCTESSNRDTVYVNTINCGIAYNDLIQGEQALARYNPINNGVFTLLRRDEVPSTTKGKLYRGVEPVIEYKIVDMHSSVNDNLLRHVFGPYTGEGAVGTSKSAYFRQLNAQKYVNYDGSIFSNFYDYYPFILAKVTFKADVIIPYVTPTMRGLAGRNSEGNTIGNFLDIGTGDDTYLSPEGFRRFEHTVFFAVAP